MTATTTEATVKIGDFFVSSWGYDQTNIDFYKVVGITPSGKSVKVQAWKSKWTSNPHAPQVGVVPGDSPRTYTDWSGVDRNADYWTQKEQKVEKDEPVVTKRLTTGHGIPAFTVNSFSYAHKWDGGVESETGVGWGH